LATQDRRREAGREELFVKVSVSKEVAWIEVGQFLDFAMPGWSRDVYVTWHVRPSQIFFGLVVLRALSIEHTADGTLTYTLTVWNVGSTTIKFDIVALYEDCQPFAGTGVAYLVQPPDGTQSPGSGGGGGGGSTGVMGGPRLE
jgi:hypothetical protein